MDRKEVRGSPTRKAALAQQLLSTISAEETIGLVLVDILAGFVVLLSVVHALRRTRRHFTLRRLFRAAWTLASLWVTWRLSGAFVPLAVLGILWRLKAKARRRRSRAMAQAVEIPFATGSPTDGEGTK